MMGNGSGVFEMMGDGSVIIILFLAAIIFYFTVYKKKLGKDIYSESEQRNKELEALKIAKVRLASGEISIEEFEQIKKRLLLP